MKKAGPEGDSGNFQEEFRGKFRFRRIERLKRREEIGAVFNHRKGVSCQGAKLFRLENGLPYNRIAFTFARKYGNAVERNRSRRVSREAYRYIRNRLIGGFDLVLLVYPGKDFLKDRSRQMEALFSRAGLLTETE
ncbi:ribonuclease P protein component [Treponema primitia ZAS-2]|uniref:Ribonuclease P protein component n=1 Tax=Treponema primitia (strain ATCC BAA-887 / DSM 12427 / ZAS-2) TaxID=545694 RepID=F5YLD4_TREPZ|nr:ribonuclease P protein component [Treponema primitia]AEF86763.1 ribonuclease P protein component [Treponema primitia ZAS-2]